MSMPPYGIKPGRRKAGPHRCDSVLHALGWTVLSAVVPGGGFLHSRRQRLGRPRPPRRLVGVVWAGPSPPRTTSGPALDLAFDPSRLTRAAIVTAVCLVLWVAVVVGHVRRAPAAAGRARRWQLMGGSAFVGALCLVVVAPVGLVVRDAFAQADFVNEVFENNQSATAPTT